MVRIMICGTRRPEDIRLLVGAGVNSIGLITEVWQDIACNLSRHQAKKLCSQIPPLVSSVLIVTKDNIDDICAITEHVNPDILQLHGMNSADDVSFIRKRLNIKIIKTLHFQKTEIAGGGNPMSRAGEFIDAGASAILLDSYNIKKAGATGQLMDLALAREIRNSIMPKPLILAGGLYPDNIMKAVEIVRPYGVDVYSGVVTDGYLDSAKVKTFINNSRMVKQYVK
jgi:phosphoribosylanthranilate isomerase